MTKNELRGRYNAAMNRYVDEVSKRKTLAFQSNPAAYTAQKQREREAEHAYQEARTAFSEAPWEEC
jgi:hypothetical protein